MRITYRYKDNKNYWQKRWDDISADEPMQNKNVYPLKYAISTTAMDKNGKILEAGCGAGRILRYYHNNGFKIKGFDFIKTAVNKLKDKDPSLDVEVGDITNMDFKDRSFDYILCFGLYHNLEKNLEKAVLETHRVLRNGGKVCASFRADNLQTKLVDYLTEKKTNSSLKSKKKYFHKINLTKKEFCDLFTKNGFKINKVTAVENMPILYKFKFFRAKNHKNFDENIARSEGYRLSSLGSVLQKFMMYFFPDQFCNIYVLIATKYGT
tara:strand:- start:1766 stop:2563 length:798 start_codon:yes stop_codon:yes gene_type:complete